MQDYQRRQAVISLLLTQSESDLEALFFSLGLGKEFRGPAAGWGRQKRVLAALAAAEERGDLPSVLQLIEAELRPDVPHPAAAALPPTATAPRHDATTTVFIVHGHDAGLRERVARLVERVGSGSLEPIILAERVDGGMTIIEKLEKYAASAGFAIVLLTPDDLGIETGSRARQNVILELGYFIGSLGRNRIAVLRKGDVELPSDVAGVLFIDADPAGAWTHKLVREMHAAGLPVDFARIP